MNNEFRREHNLYFNFITQSCDFLVSLRVGGKINYFAKSHNDTKSQKPVKRMLWIA